VRSLTSDPQSGLCTRVQQQISSNMAGLEVFEAASLRLGAPLPSRLSSRASARSSIPSKLRADATTAARSGIAASGVSLAMRHSAHWRRASIFCSTAMSGVARIASRLLGVIPDEHRTSFPLNAELSGGPDGNPGRCSRCRGDGRRDGSGRPQWARRTVALPPQALAFPLQTVTARWAHNMRYPPFCSPRLCLERGLAAAQIRVLWSLVAVPEDLAATALGAHHLLHLGIGDGARHPGRGSSGRPSS
jgi:hypothetical protein